MMQCSLQFALQWGEKTTPKYQYANLKNIKPLVDEQICTWDTYWISWKLIYDDIVRFNLGNCGTISCTSTAQSQSM